MSFLSQFSSNFTPEERGTELYSLWSQIGANAEKAYLETQTQLNAEMSDINTFSESTTRSWLAFFLKKVPYRITSRLPATLSTVGKTFVGQVTMKAGETLKDSNGKSWVLLNEIQMFSESTRDVELVQGKLVTVSGTFSSIIKIQANNPDMDFVRLWKEDYNSDGTLKKSSEIQPVTFTSSYDSLKYKGSWSPVPRWSQTTNEINNPGDIPVEPALGYTFKYTGTTVPNQWEFNHFYQYTFSGYVDLSDSAYGGDPKLYNVQEGTVSQWISGDMYNVTQSGKAKFSNEVGAVEYEFKQGDVVVFDGANWTPISSATGINPLQFQNMYAQPGVYENSPSNGFYAYYQDGFIYIKVFLGTKYDNLSGSKYVLQYLDSDGINGEMSAKDTIKFDSAFPNSDHTVNVEVDVIHTEGSTKAVNSPTGGKLSLMIKERLFSGINISSVPEYEAWFKAQPEVGDCIVLSDYERFIRSGASFETGFEVTGIVQVMLVDRFGGEIDPKQWQILSQRISPYKDIAYLQMTKPVAVRDFFIVDFTSSLNDGEFKTYAKNSIEQWFSIDFLQQQGVSLFAELNLSQVLKHLLDNDENEATGVTIDAYHFDTRSTTSGGNVYVDMSTDGEKVGDGFYRLYDGETLVDTYKEYLQSDGTALIYRGSDRIGFRTSTSLNITIPNYDSEEKEYTLNIYIPSSNEGILYVGRDDGIRKLAGVEIYKSGVQI